MCSAASTLPDRQQAACMFFYACQGQHFRVEVSAGRSYLSSCVSSRVTQEIRAQSKEMSFGFIGIMDEKVWSNTCGKRFDRADAGVVMSNVRTMGQQLLYSFAVGRLTSVATLEYFAMSIGRCCNRARCERSIGRAGQLRCYLRGSAAYSRSADTRGCRL